MKYYIKAIREEGDRESGDTYSSSGYGDLKECIKDAEKLHSIGWLYIEVSNEDGEIYSEYEN